MDCFGACQGVLGVSCGLLIGGRVWWVSPLLWKVKTVSGAAAVRIVVEESNKTETHTITPIISQSHDPTPARRSGGGRRRRHAVDGRPPSASRGGVGVHCRVPPGQDPGRPRQTFPLARERVHRRATDRHDHPATRPPEPTSRSGPSRSGTQSGIRIRGGPDGTTVTNARSTTAEPSPRRRTKPRPSWPARRQPATHDSCPPPSPTPNHHRHQHQTTDPNPTTPTPSHHPNRRSNHYRSTPHHPDATAIIEKILGH